MTEKMVTDLVKGAEGVTQLALNGATTLTAEAIRFLIFEAVLGILQAAVVFIIFFIVKKFLDTGMSTAETEKSKRIYKSASTVALVGSIVYFAAVSMPHLKDIGKALVAPNIFLMEKGYSLVKGK